MRSFAPFILLLSLSQAGSCDALGAQDAYVSPYQRWKNGLPKSKRFFPIGVWLQSPGLVKRYQALGINVYVGLWDGPTPQQLATLAKAKMPVIGAQTHAALKAKKGSPVAGWLQRDEPDNAQKRKEGGYGPPIEPDAVVKFYNQLREADPSRPVLLNLGQGVANDAWKGRGTRFGHLEDYPRYAKGCDILSFDIYPVTHRDPAVRGRLELIGKGVERLVRWSGGEKIIWNFIECTHIHSAAMPTPAQVRSEVWMALIHGSQGIVYFAHEWKPKFRAAGMLKYPKMAAAIGKLNAQVLSLAEVLNQPSVTDAVQVTSSKKDVPIRAMTKRLGEDTYVFAVAMRNRETQGTVRLRGLRASDVVEVLHESRTIEAQKGLFRDSFAGYGVHIYRIRRAKRP